MGRDLLRLDTEAEVVKIARFIRTTVEGAGAKGTVVGISGGVDSAVVGELCVRALGKSRVTTMLLPSKHTPRSDLRDAVSLSTGWGTKTYTIPIDGVVDAISSASGMGGHRLANANMQARVRMTILYLAANTNRRLVAGTGDRSEEEVGFFTKFGDGGVDFLPIAHLYKTQVRALGAHLGLPGRIVRKPASPQLWPGHTAAQELPLDYDRLDVVLNCLYVLKLSRRQSAVRAEVPESVVARVMEMHESSAHKRSLPPSLAKD